jgi:hypothetical protein
MLKKIIFILLCILLNSNYSYAANNNNPTISIDRNHSLFPVFSKDIKNYAMYDCHKKYIKFALSNGKKTIKYNDFFVNDQVRTYKGVISGYSYDFTIRCLNNGWRQIDYKYNNLSKTDNGFILGKFMYNASIVSCPDENLCKSNATVLYIVDNNGVPMWYRYFQGHSNFTGFQLRGSKLEWFATRYMELAGQDNSVVSGRVMSLDLKENNIISNVMPYEIVDGVKVYPPIDFHDYKSTDKYFYFISYVDKIVKPSSVSSIFSDDSKKVDKNLNPDIERKEAICKGSDKILLRESRIIRTDKKGLVNWSYEIKNVPTYGVTINIRDEKNFIRCEIDLQHPNWLSLDDDESNITVSLHNSGTYNIDIKNKEINWVLSNEVNPYMRNADIDTGKLLKTLNDPMKGVTRTHSGSFINNSDLFLTFDNRMDPAETARAVIYKINKEKKTATFIKALKSPEDKCSLVNSTLYCMSRTMGNATYTPTGEIIVNWGERPGGRNVYTVYDKDYKPKLDVTYGSKVFFSYKHEYYDSKFFDKNFFSYDFLKSTNNKNNYLLFIKTKFICDQYC